MNLTANLFPRVVASASPLSSNVVGLYRVPRESHGESHEAGKGQCGVDLLRYAIELLGAADLLENPRAAG